MTALYRVPAWLVLVLAVILSVALACGLLLLIRRRFAAVDFAAHNAVAGIILGVVGSLFTVTLAFIIAIVWQEYDGTSQRCAVEVAAASDLWHTARGFPPPLGPQLRRDVVRYADLLVHDEWPAMRRGAASARTEAQVSRIFDEIVTFRPHGAGEATAQSAALGYIAALHDARSRRLDDNASGVSVFEWAILWIGALAVMGICLLVGLTNLRAQLLLTAALAGMIAVMFVLVFELDYPFRGDLFITSHGWKEFIALTASE